MYLTTSNAKQYVGKQIDCKIKKRFFHNYPLKVVKGSDNNFYFIDRANTMMRVPTDTDLFNSVYFDSVDEVQHGKSKTDTNI